jgi:hypothetical protein
VSWPVFIFGLIWNAREGKRHTEQQLTEQTTDIKDFAADLTREQTEELERRRARHGYPRA